MWSRLIPGGRTLLALLAACNAYDTSLLNSQRYSAADAFASCLGVQASETCNGKDDDCDGVLDEDTADCDRPHRTGRCVFGACVDDGCEKGFADCNHVADDGCERFVGACSDCEAACVAPLADAGSRRTAPSTAIFGVVDASTAVADAGVEVAAPDGPANRAPTDAAVTGARTPNVADEPDLDAGADSPPESAGSDAGPKSGASGGDCDALADCSGSAAACQQQRMRCSCLSQAPTGLGPECDRCACEACLGDLSPCIFTANPAWNAICGSLSRCVGDAQARGLCHENICPDQCETEHLASGMQLSRGPGTLFTWWCDYGSVCTTFLAIQDNCYATTCAQACKP